MPLFNKSINGVERHSIRAIRTSASFERIASIWMKSASGLVKIYESVRSCFGSGRWISRKPWINKEKWNND